MRDKVNVSDDSFKNKERVTIRESLTEGFLEEFGLNLDLKV